MVSELGGGQPPSPTASLPGADRLEAGAAHPVGTVTVSCHPQALLAPSAAAPPLMAPPAEDPEQQPASSDDAMAVDAPSHLPSCSPSPAPYDGTLAAAAAAGEQHQPSHAPQRQASPFVPLSEMGGGPAAARQHLLLQHQPSAGLVATSDDEGGSQPPPPGGLQRPCSGGSGGLSAGYESGDDMDVLNMRHCTNCTGALWGHICTDCGHMPTHDADIFHPTVASAAALHRPRLQGDALTVLCWDERMELHEEAGNSMHPERPDRVRAVMARLQAAELAGRCRRLPAREATPSEIHACHIPQLLSAVDMLSEQSRLQGNAGLHFSPDTFVNEHTAMCAKLSAGACVDVAGAVARGEARAGVAVVRPPGHHAESNTAMGFCFFNNAGIAARAAQAAGAERVLILDWDVHHGNGTQHIFEDDPSVLYMSLHRHDGGSFYPGTGAAHEVGEGPGEGFTVNVPWPCGGLRNGDYLAAFQHVLLPIAYEFAPDMVIISAGFDAAEGDPIGGCHLTPECFAHMAAQLQLVAPTVALLEGGYNLMATAAGTEAVVRVLLGERPPLLPAAEQRACEYGMAAVAQAMRIQARHWDCMRGLVQQQFKVLAAAAARQEQLAAMKRRREEAVAAAAAGRSGCESLFGELEDEEEEEEEGEDGHHSNQHHHRHGRQSHGGALRHAGDSEDDDDGGAEESREEEEDVVAEYRSGSGWESDADLASDEQQLSPGEDATSEEEEQEEEEEEQGGRHQQAAGDSDASPPPEEHPRHPQQQQQQQQRGLELQRAASDTEPLSEGASGGSSCLNNSNSGGNGSQQRAAAADGVDTPAAEQSLAAASDTPPAAAAALQPGLAAAAPAAAQAPRAPPAAAAQQQQQQQHWAGLSVLKAAMKRRSPAPSYKRIPAGLLFDDDSLDLLQHPARPQQQAGGAAAQQQQEHVVPQQEEQ